MKVTTYNIVTKESEYEVELRLCLGQDNTLNLVETYDSRDVSGQDRQLLIELSQAEIKNMLIALAKMLK